jgi:hypothetical protein
MEITDFTRALSRLSGEELRAVAASIEAHHRSAGDEVDAWRAVLHIDQVLRKTGKSRQAALAAHSATQAVLAAARSIDAVPDADATKLARSAAMVARGMVAGEAAECDVRRLMGDWAPVVQLSHVSDAAA